MYNTPHARGLDDSTVVGEVDMFLTKSVSGDRATENMGVFSTSGSGKSWAMESAHGYPYVSKLKARVVNLKSQIAQITQLLVKMSGSLWEGGDGGITLRDKVPGRTRLLRQKRVHSLGVIGQ